MTCSYFKRWNKLTHQPVMKFPHSFSTSLQAKTAGISKLGDDEVGSILQNKNKLALRRPCVFLISWMINFDCLKKEMLRLTQTWMILEKICDMLLRQYWWIAWKMNNDTIKKIEDLQIHAKTCMILEKTCAVFFRLLI